MTVCAICWDKKFCPTCQGDGSLPIDDVVCPTCGGAGACPRCQLRRPDGPRDAA